MPARIFEAVFEIAADQHGYVTTAQAEAAGVGRRALNKMARRGSLQRISSGLYRLVHFPFSPWGQYMEAVLWPRGVRGVVSHETALAIHGLSDVSPTRVHITVPRAYRVRRKAPAVLAIHRADLPEADLDTYEGIPLTTPERTIRDCHADHLGPALVRQAIEDGRRTGLLRPARADALERELLGTPSPPASR